MSKAKRIGDFFGVSRFMASTENLVKSNKVSSQVIHNMMFEGGENLSSMGRQIVDSAGGQLDDVVKERYLQDMAAQGMKEGESLKALEKIQKDIGHIKTYGAKTDADWSSLMGGYKDGNAKAVDLFASKSETGEFTKKSMAASMALKPGRFFSAADYAGEGGARALMAGKRIGATAMGVTAVGDGLQMLSGDRGLMSEDGRTNLPIIPFL